VTTPRRAGLLKMLTDHRSIVLGASPERFIKRIESGQGCCSTVIEQAKIEVA